MDAVIFSDVTLNTGNAYNATTGEFTAPVKGHYSFTWTITTNGGTLFSTQLVFNGKPVSYNYVNGKHGVNHEMESNDVVSIRAYDQGELAFRESLPSKCGPPLRALNCKLHIYYCNGIKNKQLYVYKLSFEEQIMCLRSFECFIALFCPFIYEVNSNVS